MAIYRRNFYGLIENRLNWMKGYGEMRYLTFALAKGRLAKKTLALLEQIGITCEEMKDPTQESLYL